MCFFFMCFFRPLINNCKKYMLATCRELFENIFHGSHMRIIPQRVSGHVRDTCMKIFGINKRIFTCWLHVENASVSIMYLFVHSGNSDLFRSAVIVFVNNTMCS